MNKSLESISEETKENFAGFIRYRLIALNTFKIKLILKIFWINSIFMNFTFVNYRLSWWSSIGGGQ